MTRCLRLCVVAACVAILSTGACQSEDDDAPEPAAAFTTVECPADVRTAMTGSAECGRLTVPESRSGSDRDRRITVFVTIVRAPVGDARRDPMVVAPGTAVPNYKGIAPLAERVRRDVIIVDGRGVAHSEPTLDCLGVDAAVPDAWSRPSGDASVATRLRDAVAKCYADLDDAGIDVAAYDTTESAADLVDLREALGVDQWNLISYGAPSRTALELLRQDTDHVRSLVMDSPEAPGSDPHADAGAATERALRSVLTACEADLACSAGHPDAAGLLDRALSALDADPILLSDTGSARAPLLDAGLLVRALRESLSNSAHLTPTFSVGGVPDLLTAAAAGDAVGLSQDFDQLVAYGTPTCLAYSPSCQRFLGGYLGAQLTRLCRDVAPFASAPVPSGAPGFTEVFDHSPYWAFCDVWPVRAAEASVAAAPDWDGPVLVALGSHDPYTDPEVVRRLLSGLTSASYVVHPAKGHNAMSSPCALDRRNAWLDDPDPFADNPCSEEKIAWNR